MKKVNLRGGTLIDGFPSGALANSIASMCFMNSVLNELVSIIDSPSFPPVSFAVCCFSFLTDLDYLLLCFKNDITMG